MTDEKPVDGEETPVDGVDAPSTDSTDDGEGTTTPEADAADGAETPKDGEDGGEPPAQK